MPGGDEGVFGGPGEGDVGESGDLDSDDGLGSRVDDCDGGVVA